MIGVCSRPLFTTLSVDTCRQHIEQCTQWHEAYKTTPYEYYLKQQRNQTNDLS